MNDRNVIWVWLLVALAAVMAVGGAVLLAVGLGDYRLGVGLVLFVALAAPLAWFLLPPPRAHDKTLRP